jgi:monoamine oxidase
LAGELGVPTYKTWAKGSHLLVGDGRTRRYKGLIPNISPLALVTIAMAQSRINRMAKRVPVEQPWLAPDAAKWDAETVGGWLERVRISTPIGRDLFDMAVRGLFATDLNDVSLLHLLFLAHAHGGIDKLFSIEGGAQENMVTGGLGELADRIASELGDALRVGSPVRRVALDKDVVRVGADGCDVVARHLIVSMPPALVLDIEWDPVLPVERRDLYAVAVAGVETKTMLVYDEPFWRGDGLSGQSAEPGSAAEVTIDASPADGSAGVLASFTFGAVAARVDALPTSDRRAAVTAALTARFGPRAGRPAAFVETAWWQEPWSRGCSLAHLPPGMLTRHGHLLAAPMGRVHWAGTETATVSHGSVDGAIRSGQRAAHEVLDRLS